LKQKLKNIQKEWDFVAKAGVMISKATMNLDARDGAIAKKNSNQCMK